MTLADIPPNRLRIYETIIAHLNHRFPVSFSSIRRLSFAPTSVIRYVPFAHSIPDEAAD